MSILKVETIQTIDDAHSIASSRVAQGTAAAWVIFTGTGTVSIRESYNVGSITDNGTGDYTINFVDSLTDTNYTVVSKSGQYGNSNAYPVDGSETVAGIRIIVWDGGQNANRDNSSVHVVVFR
jgi:hypothetical protein